MAPVTVGVEVVALEAEWIWPLAYLKQHSAIGLRYRRRLLARNLEDWRMMWQSINSIPVPSYTPDENRGEDAT
jgi:hypothetical protein